jgi:catechol 2,3-dioxygenase-like lactoylglutathione lyase family enzyme
MIDHMGVQVADVDASARYYLEVFAPIGMQEVMRFPAGPAGGVDPDGSVSQGGSSVVVGLAGPDGIPKFWLSPAQGSEARELHVAFIAPDRQAVDAVHKAAVAAGSEVLHAPREFPEYHPGYYGVFLRDLDGHNVEAVFHGQ